MFWTKEKPTRPGWYWNRDVYKNGDRSSHVAFEVSEVDGQLVVWDSSEYNLLADLSGNHEWAGPIPEPIDEDELTLEPSVIQCSAFLPNGWMVKGL